MYEEYNVLVKSGTWLLIPRPACVNKVWSIWLFKLKFHADRTLSRYKARLVANGSIQQVCVDFNQAFSPVVNPATVRTILSLVCLPPGFVNNRYTHHVCILQRSFYGLKQAPCAWFQQFAGYATPSRFYHSRCDSLLFIYRQGSQVAYLLIYVDDIILTASCPALLQQIIGSLNNEFDMTDHGTLNHFLGISADRTLTGLFLSQKKYALQLLERAHMVTCNPSRTPVDTESKPGPKVQQIFLYMHDLRKPHIAALKRILRYVRGTVDFGVQLYVFATTSLVGYIDADWAVLKQNTGVLLMLSLKLHRPACVNMVRSIWLFKHKFHADGTLRRYKARLVANGSSQQVGVDFDQTFSPVVNRPPFARSLALSCLFAGYATRAEFDHSCCDSSLFIYRQGFQVAYFLIYVDDIILTASCPALLQQIIGSLNNEFDITDLGALNYFLDISADRTPTDSKLGPEGVPIQDPTLYRSLAGGLQEPHFAALKRILRYVRGTVDFGLQLYVSATTSLVGYTDADWAGYPSTR
nr:ribonuclease H-like domain-containing protein [Tanacetum cinerariifolium]